MAKKAKTARTQRMPITPRLGAWGSAQSSPMSLGEAVATVVRVHGHKAGCPAAMIAPHTGPCVCGMADLERHAEEMDGTLWGGPEVLICNRRGA